MSYFTIFKLIFPTCKPCFTENECGYKLHMIKIMVFWCLLLDVYRL